MSVEASQITYSEEQMFAVGIAPVVGLHYAHIDLIVVTSQVWYLFADDLVILI